MSLSFLIIYPDKKMIDTIERFLQKYDLTSPNKTLLVGFSGGYDSLCLLDIINELAQQYKFKLVAMHLNHNWRGEESLQDERNCKGFCEKSDIEYVSEILENGNKTESFAREARYNFFLQQAKKYQNCAILTAHTLSDNAETIIYRIAKGTGINGLRGIPAVRNLEGVSVYRPMLSISREQIENYCNSKGLVANMDSSNLDTHYKRNFIRHKIMPLFNEINFKAENAISNLATLATSNANIIEEYMSLVKKDLFEDGKILTEKFKTLSDDVMCQILYDIGLKENLDYDYKKITNILEFIKSNFNSKSGSRCSITNNLWVFANSKHIYMITKTKSEKNSNEIEILNEGEYEIPETECIFSLKKYTENKNLKFPPENANFAYVNLDDINEDLIVRTRREGDVITPFGMTGTMKLKKYLTSKGIPQHKKDELILLCNSTEVLWVAGVGLSNKLKVVNQPSHVLELKCKT